MVALPNSLPTTIPASIRWRRMAERAAAKAGVPFRIRRLLRDREIGWQAHAEIVEAALDALTAQNLTLNERERLADVVRHRFTAGCLTSIVLLAEREQLEPDASDPDLLETAAKEAMRDAQGLLIMNRP